LLFGLLWQLVAHTNGQLATPAKVWQAAITLFSDPCYQKGPNDRASVERAVVTQSVSAWLRIAAL